MLSEPSPTWESLTPRRLKWPGSGLVGSDMVVSLGAYQLGKVGGLGLTTDFQHFLSD